MSLGAYLTALGAGGAGFLLNQSSSAINSRRAWKYAQKAMALQDQYNRNMIRDYYTLNRQSLTSAGYNPLLGIAGSNAQGASYSPTMLNADSDAGSQAVDSAIGAMNTASTIKLNNANSAVAQKQEELLKSQKEHQDLENKKLEAENNFNPKVIGSDIISGVGNKTVSAIGQGIDKVKNLAKKSGIELPDLPPLPEILEHTSNSAKTSVKQNKAINKVKSDLNKNLKDFDKYRKKFKNFSQKSFIRI